MLKLVDFRGERILLFLDKYEKEIPKVIEKNVVTAKLYYHEWHVNAIVSEATNQTVLTLTSLATLCSFLNHVITIKLLQIILDFIRTL